MNEVSQFRCRRLCSVLTQSLGGKKINWHSILRVHRNSSIQFTHVGHCVVNITIIVHFHWAHLASFDWCRNVIFLLVLLLVWWIIDRTKTVKPFFRKTANHIKQAIMPIIAIIKIISENMKKHTYPRNFFRRLVLSIQDGP